MTALIAAAVVAGLGWLSTAALIGLWLGERRARITAEAVAGFRPPTLSRRRRDAPDAPDAPDAGEAGVFEAPAKFNPTRAAKRVKSLYPGMNDDVAEEIARTVITAAETGG